MRPLRYPLNSHLRIYAKLVYVFLKNYTTFLNSCITMVDRIEFGLPPSLALSLSLSRTRSLAFSRETVSYSFFRQVIICTNTGVMLLCVVNGNGWSSSSSSTKHVGTKSKIFGCIGCLAVCAWQVNTIKTHIKSNRKFASLRAIVICVRAQYGNVHHLWRNEGRLIFFCVFIFPSRMCITFVSLVASNLKTV